MKITKNKNKKNRFNGTVSNDEDGRKFIRNMRKLGLTVNVRGRHSDRKSLVGKIFFTGLNGKKIPLTHEQIRNDGYVSIKFAEYLSVTVYSH